MLKKFDLSTTVDSAEGLQIHIVHIQGYLDSSTFQELQDHLQGLIDQDVNRLIVDFAQLNYISSAGLGVMMGMMQEVRQLDGDLKIVNLSEKIQNLFDMLGFSRMIRIYDSLESAKQAFVEENQAAKSEKHSTDEGY